MNVFYYEEFCNLLSLSHNITILLQPSFHSIPHLLFSSVLRSNKFLVFYFLFNVGTLPLSLYSFTNCCTLLIDTLYVFAACLVVMSLFSTCFTIHFIFAFVNFTILFGKTAGRNNFRTPQTGF